MENIIKAENWLKEKLLEVDLRIHSINDFIHTNESYPEAIPVLLEFLSYPTPIWWKEGIARALTVKEAKGLANNLLLEIYNETDKQEYSSFCWSIGNAFTEIIFPEDVDAILRIVKDEYNGISRQMFVMALAKIKSRKEDIENTLIPLLADDDITGHVLYSLGILRSEKAREKIMPFLNHPKAYYRREAKKALNKIDKR